MNFKDKFKSIFSVGEEDYDDARTGEAENYEQDSYDDYSYETSEQREYQSAPRHKEFRTNDNVVDFQDEPYACSPVSILKLQKYEDVEMVADIFKSNKVVVINTEECSEAVCKNILYFLAGVVYGLGGKLKSVAGRAYVLTPRDVPVSGAEKEAEDTYETFI